MDTVSLIREKIDIVSFISEYIPLKKLGRNFKTTCPFHGEKTPSFVVSPERQIWHCFGCGKGGDCFTFLMEYEHLEFPEALRILAKKTGIELESSSFDTSTSSKKEKIYRMNYFASEFYQYLLFKHPIGKKALSYIQNDRGIKSGIAEQFAVGFAPGTGNALCQYLMQKKKYTKEELVDSGLAVYRRGAIGDFFMNRLVFPLIDHRGNIVGFSGRALDTTNFGSKYINTRDTLVYHKGSHFFGLHLAKEIIKKLNHVIIVEGEFDVISCFQNGIKNTVAIKGTALTENQVALLSRFTTKVSLCFDTDSAGQEAIKRSLHFLEKKGLTTTVITISNGKDPDESLKKDYTVFKKALENDIGVYDYLLTRAIEQHDKNTIDGKKKISEELILLFSGIENEIIKEHYLRKLSVELDTSLESIHKQVEKMITGQKSDITQLTSRIDKKDRQEMLENYLLSLILQNENIEQTIKMVRESLKDFTFKTSVHDKLFRRLIEFIEKYQRYDHKKFIAILPAELIKAFDISFLFPLPKFPDGKKYIEEINNTIHELRFLSLKSRIKEISFLIKEKEKNNNVEEIEALQTEFNRLVRQLGSHSIGE